MNATRADFEQVLAAAAAVHLHIEGEEILHSDSQGIASEAMVSIDKWLSWRDNALRLQVRVIAKDSAGNWEGISDSGFSDPLTKAQAHQLVTHWAALERDARVREIQRRAFQAPLVDEFKLSAVTIDVFAAVVKIPAYLNSKRWNGWRMPHFPESSMAQVLTLFPDVTYDAEQDAYMVPDDEGPYPVRAETITTADGQTVKVYPVGAGSWCWDEVDE